MDKNVSAKEASEDLTRESLIAIAYSLPGKDGGLKTSPEIVENGSRPDTVKGDGAEKYRSQLISISNSESPEDIIALPALPGGIQG